MSPSAPIGAAPDLAFVAAAAEQGPMMEDGPSVVLFVGVVVAVSVAAALILPGAFRRLPLRYGVPALALVGPALAVIGSLVGTLAMTLSGHDIWYSLAVALCAGSAATFVGLRLARPVARDLDRVARTVEAVATGDRAVRADLDRTDEIGHLAATVDALTVTLARAEAERLAADDERRAVVSALSHDLRTPLASLLVSVDALSDGLGDPNVHLQAMRGNIMALERLVEDLFLLARVDSGRLALSAEIHDLAELVDEAVEAVAPMADIDDVVVRAELDGPILIEGDDGGLGRVFRNLLDNAIRFSPPGGTVAIVDRSDRDQARLAFLDEGPGFAESFVPRAFDRFTQADDARSSPGGAGLGLSIAKTVLEAHGGSIRIEPGPGGFVEIELPIGSADSGPGAGSASAVGDRVAEDRPSESAERSGVEERPLTTLEP